jgi:transcriptional regulator with XRE-family HTH domain
MSISRLHNASGLTYEQVARRVGMARQNVWAVVHGRRAVPLSLLLFYADRARLSEAETLALIRTLGTHPSTP